MTDLLLYLIYIVPFLAFLALAGWAAIGRVNSMTDAEVLALWADDLPAEIKTNEEFKAAYVVRALALKETQSRKGRK